MTSPRLARLRMGNSIFFIAAIKNSQDNGREKTQGGKEADMQDRVSISDHPKGPKFPDAEDHGGEASFST